MVTKRSATAPRATTKFAHLRTDIPVDDSCSTAYTLFIPARFTHTVAAESRNVSFFTGFHPETVAALAACLESTPLLSSYALFDGVGSQGHKQQDRCCFTSTETILRTVRDREPRTATSTFTHPSELCLATVG